MRRGAIFAAANESKDSFAEEIRLESKDVKILIDIHNQDPKRPSPQRHIASFTNDQKALALLEWRYVDGEFNYADKKTIRSRIKSLVYVLSLGNSSQFGLLKCVGFFKDEEYQDKTAVERYGLVFKLPEPVSQHLLPTNPASNALLTPPAHFCPRTLAEHITRTTASKTLPTLSDRFRIATALCHTVLQIHAAGWLHKAIQSSNLLFSAVPSANGPTSSNLDLAHPFLLGFEFSRPDRPATPSLELPKDRTSNDYRHPSLWPPATADAVPATPVRFKKQYDIYALGVVLLEIGTWSLVSSISGTRDIRQPWAWRDLLLQRAKVLGYLCGSVYQRVVETCLAGNFVEGDSVPEEQMQRGGQSERMEAGGVAEEDDGQHEGSVKQSFLFDVVYELSRCYA